MSKGNGPAFWLPRPGADDPRRLCRGDAHDPVGAVGPRQLPAGAGEGLREGERGQGQGRDRALAGLPDQGLPGVRRPGRRLRHGGRRLPMAGRGLDRRPLRRSDRLLRQAQRRQADGPGHRHRLRGVSAKGSGKFWAIPLEGDATGWAYRKDWFEDPKEKAAFKKKYDYDLAVPKTWAQLRDIAEFFHRPDQKRYGIAIYTDNGYDALVMGIENVLFGFGADWATTDLQGAGHHQQPSRRSRRSSSTRSSTASRRPAGARSSSWRTTRPSPKGWRR